MTENIANDFTNITLPPHIKAVILDFDNTCYLYEPCHKRALLAVQDWFDKEFGLTPDFTKHYHEAQLVVKSRIPEHGASHSRILYFKNILENLNKPNPIKNSLLMERLYWDTFRQEMQPVSGLMAFLADCKKNGTTVIVVSDLTTTIQCEKISSLGIDSYVDFLITSEEVGAEKPDSRGFRLALEKANSKAKEAVVIGDSKERDIIGANALGIFSILITHEITPIKSSL